MPPSATSMATVTAAIDQSPIQVPTPTLNAFQIMDLFDKGKLTQEEAVTMLEKLKETSLADSTPTPTAMLVPVPTATKRPFRPSPTKTQGAAEEVDCPNCDWDFVPLVGGVEWLDPPKVLANGLLSLRVRVGEKEKLTFPNQPGGGASNIALTNGGTKLYGMVIPPAPPGMTWNPTPGQWVADTYHLRGGVFTVSARVDTRVVNQTGLTLCLWTGGRGSANRVLDCIMVARP